MKNILCFVLLCCSLPSIGQTFLIKEGKLSETTADSTLDYGSPLPHFYSVDGKYPTGSAAVLKDVKAFLAKQKIDPSGSGYITYRFIIDTTGHIGNKVKVMQTDEEYKARSFEKPLIEALGAFIQTLDKWKIARYRTGEALEYIAFITFKMKNGKVINIIP